MVRLILGFVFLGFLAVHSHAQENREGVWANSNLHFKYYTNNDGLPQNSVNDIECDKFGFVWLATGNGLSRFDGYRFVNYSKPQLPSNLVNVVACANDGKLWIGTKQGLCRFDVESEQIELLAAVNNNGADVSVISLFCDSHGNIWAGTHEAGLFLVQPDTDGYEVRQFDAMKGEIPGDIVPEVKQLSNGTLFIGTNHGVATYDYQTKTFNDWQHDLLSNSYVLSICETRDGQIWVGTFFGAYVQNGFNGTGRWFYPDPFNSQALSHGRINDIVQDTLGNVYLGTLSGINVFNPANSTFFRIPSEQFGRNSLNSQFVNCLYTDAQGNVWVGTEKGGVNQFNVFQKPFYSLVHQVDNGNSLSHNTINSVLVDGHDYWIGTAGGGLNHYNETTKQFKHYRYDPANISSVSSDFITSLLKLPNGQLWLGTWGGGLCRMNSNGSFVRYAVPINDPETNNVNAFVSSVMYDPKDGLLFVGTEGGLAVMDVASQTFLPLNAANSALAQISEIGCLYKDTKGYIWAGTRNGLYRFSSRILNQPYNAIDPDSQVQFFNSSAQKQTEGSLPGGYIISLFEDRDGVMWIGTYGDGLLKCTVNGNGALSFKQYTQNNGLSNNVVYAIQQDKGGMLWLSTDNGLSKFDAATDQFDNYFAEDGLLGDQFYWSASCKGADGKLFFGGVNGLNYFDPDKFVKNEFKPKVEIVALRAFNQPIAIGEKRHGNVVLPRSLALADEVELSYKDNVFSIEFSALDYLHPQKVKYAYKLEGVDNDWVLVGANQRLAHYTNLRGGSYLFKVKSTNSDGVWNSEYKQLTITVLPPFWQTGWFQLILIGVIVAVAVVYSRYHSRRLIAQKAKLERMVHLRTEQIEEQSQTLKQQANELFNANKILEQRQQLIEGQKHELESKNAEISQQRDHVMALNTEIEKNNQLRLSFFTNISHEFRTPLTLIVSPIERLTKQTDLPQSVRETLKIVYRNAKRLHLLIDQLLTFRRIETGNLRLQIEKGNLSVFAGDVFEAFEGLAAQRHVQYNFVDHLNNEKVWFDRGKLEDVLYNLLSNAFKYSPEKSAITLALSKGELAVDGQSIPAVQIEVSDDGIGIAPDVLPLIFDSFYRASAGSSANGSGIGLALTAELVEAMNGKITVDSDLGKGCRFVVKIPCLPEHLGNAEMVDAFSGDASELEGKVQVVHDHFSDDEHFLFENTIEEQSSKPSLLVVEDNKELLAFISDAFRDDYKVLAAENGKIGYELARKHLPELVLSDIMMPEMDGIELCKNLKSNLYTSHIPVVLLTAKTLVENQLEGLGTGADDYIPKPFNLDVLRLKMANIIEARNKLRQKFCAQPDLLASESVATSIDEKFLAKAYQILEANYVNPDFNVELFSEMMYVSRSLLYKKLKALVDLSPNDFVTVYRLKKSLGLLAAKDLSVNEVAYRIGFNDPKYFSRVFKKFYNKTPSEYLAG